MSTSLNQLIRERNSTLYEVLSELDVVNLATSLDALTKTVGSLSAKIGDLTQNLDNLTVSVNHQAQEIVKIDGRINTLTSIVTSLQEAVGELPTTVDQLGQQVAKLDERVTTLEPLSHRVLELDERVTKLADDVDTWGTLVHEANLPMLKYRVEVLEQSLIEEEEFTKELEARVYRIWYEVGDNISFILNNYVQYADRIKVELPSLLWPEVLHEIPAGPGYVSYHKCRLSLESAATLEGVVQKQTSPDNE